MLSNIRQHEYYIFHLLRFFFWPLNCLIYLCLQIILIKCFYDIFLSIPKMENIIFMLSYVCWIKTPMINKRSGHQHVYSASTQNAKLLHWDRVNATYWTQYNIFPFLVSVCNLILMHLVGQAKYPSI
jgi:hypothetical protein